MNINIYIILYVYVYVLHDTITKLTGRNCQNNGPSAGSLDAESPKSKK